MTNYHKLYNSWLDYAKPKRQLLLEQEPIPVENSQLEVGPNEHSFKVKVKSREFVKLTTDAKTLKDVERRAAAKEKFDIEKSGKMFLRLDINGQVIEHEGRARNLLNVMTNGENAELEIEIIIPKDKKSLNRENFPQILGQPNLADNLVIAFNDLIPSVITKEQEQSLKDDPLKVGQEKQFTGYSLPPISKAAANSIQNVIDSFYSNNKVELKKIGIENIPQYVNLLNALYVATDSDGNQYTFGFTPMIYFDRNDKTKKLPGGGSKFINLVPHPYESAATEQEANSRTYKIIKK